MFRLMHKQCASQNRLTKFMDEIILFDFAFSLMQVYSAFLKEVLLFLQAVLNRINFFLDVKNQIGPVRILEVKNKINK